MTPIRLTIPVLLAVVVCGCASVKPREEKSYNRYRNQFDFVWESAQEELRANWRIASVNPETKTIVTEWDTQLSPMATFGRRSRLTAVVTGDQEAGWDITCTQESERNNEAQNPLDEKEASWEAAANDGGLARRFLQNLDRKLKPNEAWKRDAIR